MGWADLLQVENEELTLPWTGGRSLRLRERCWTLNGRQPREYGWWTFKIHGRDATTGRMAEPQTDLLKFSVTGYLVGDRIVPDGVRVDPEPSKILNYSEQVFLIEDGIDRFSRVVAGRLYDGGPLVYVRLDMPTGVEDQVLEAFFDRKTSLRGIKGVSPALDAAFRLERFHREEVERRRAELERLRREEEERLAREAARQQLMQLTGNAESRRQLAQVDFAEGARAALRVGNAEYLDHQAGRQRGEMVVRFRIDGRRFECVCDARTLRIVDSGICLRDSSTGEQGDTRFTLESLPSVIRQAQRERVLHVYRHVDDWEEDDD